MKVITAIAAPDEGPDRGVGKILRDIEKQINKDPQPRREGVGVVIGRFQIDYLHQGHVHLIREANKEHLRLLILVGVSPNTGTKKEPLPYLARQQMIKAAFPDAIILPLPDQPGDDRAWSVLVDQMISSVAPSEPATLYGSRDSFIPVYTGKYKTKTIEPLPYASASNIRESLSQSIEDHHLFRRGVIYGVYNRSSIPIIEVQGAFWRKDQGKNIHLLVVKDKSGWRLPGRQPALSHQSPDETLWKLAYDLGMEVQAERNPLGYKTTCLVVPGNPPTWVILRSAQYIFGGATIKRLYEDYIWVDITAPPPSFEGSTKENINLILAAARTLGS
jgi:hypothetical protein